MGNRSTLALRQVVFAIREGSDAASNAAISIDNIAPIPVPEPATLLLLASGTVLLRRRRACPAGRRRVS